MSYQFIPSIILGLFDYLQVILFAIGMVFLAKFTYRNEKKPIFYTLIIGVTIATLAGLSKATWKLTYAITQNSIDILNNVHMYGLAIGTFFIFIATIFITRIKKDEIKRDSTFNAFPFFHITVGLLSISTIGYLICLIRYASRKHYKWAIVAFSVYLVIALANAGISGNREHEIIHWIAQSLGVISNTFLIYGTYTINKRDLETAN